MDAESMSTAERVVAVVVAYNRRDLLREALDGLHAQSRPLDSVVVVDNASTDDSAEIARQHPLRADVVTLERNTGGAGGFAVGLARALSVHGADLVWIMDDDTVPTASALEQLLAVRVGSDRPPVALGSRVIWTDGSEHPMNRPRKRPGARWTDRDRARGAMPVRSSSFVSFLVDGSAARATPLPIVDYFIWNDDFEYSTRLLRRADGFYCNGSVVVHKTKALGSTDVDPGERFYYEVRNKLWLFRFSDGLSAGEKVLYGGSTALRWVRTMLRSGDRGTLWRSGRRGWVDGLRSRPRSNAVALADLPAAAGVLAEYEAAGLHA
jgi:rhamnopyranosyl-N-acetylglucosaminyl-diphospho-decaprenol beta-1,3/1,4-galactofuranosyltransferase